MRNISGAAVSIGSWTAWPYASKEWLATHERPTLRKGETCSHHNRQRQEYAPPDVAVIIWNSLLLWYAACYALPFAIWPHWMSCLISCSPDAPSWRLD